MNPMTVSSVIIHGTDNTSATACCLQCGSTTICTRRCSNTHLRDYGDVELVSLQCEECSHYKHHVRPAASPRLQAIQLHFTVRTIHDLSSVIVKSRACKLSIPSIGVCIPLGTSYACIATLNNVLLEHTRRIEHECDRSESNRRIHLKRCVKQLHSLLNMKQSFEVEMNDWSGNSCVHWRDNVSSSSDNSARNNSVTTQYYERNQEQTDFVNDLFGESNIMISTSSLGCTPVEVDAWAEEDFDEYFDIESERIATLPSVCECCSFSNTIKMVVISFTGFGDAIFTMRECDECGSRQHQVAMVGGVSTRGKRCTLVVKNLEDLQRQVLKSESSSVEIPELGLEMLSGTLGGKFTTLEGILQGMILQLQNSSAFIMGDDGEAERSAKLKIWLTRFSAMVRCEDGEPWSFVIDDPLGNCFINPVIIDDNVNTDSYDNALSIVEYERSPEQNAQLGVV